MKIFDTHCHIFNASILKDMIAYSKITKPKATCKGIGSWWDWISELSSALFNSEKTNHKFLVKSLKNGFSELGADEYGTIPLMMDIHFLFSEPLKINETISDGTLYLDKSLQDQIKCLQKLSKNGNCYPFFAVDPRRTGIIKAIIDGQFITKSAGGFYGIKLYPRLGYHPMSGNLPELYAYCAKNKIPITTHCSNGGFPPWTTSSGEFTNPENFRPALEANPNLIINFAHFGHGNDSWGYKIVELMRTYPNVYADLACYTGDVDLMYFKVDYWKEPIVQQRTMYGSDFDVFYLTQTNFDMNNYISSFKSRFSQEELKNMMGTIPNKFLGI